MNQAKLYILGYKCHLDLIYVILKQIYDTDTFNKFFHALKFALIVNHFIIHHFYS